MKNFQKIIVVFIVLVSIVSCGDKRTRSLQYMPDMYVSVPYEPNGVGAPYNNGVVDRDPVVGTIARGHVPYEYANTIAAYELAKKEVKSPIDASDKNLKNGKKMYTIYCATCHGKKGDGNGVLAQREKFNGVPNYKDRDITQGSIYHVIMHGKGIMGSHASQLLAQERWQIVQYVETLRNDLLK